MEGKFKDDEILIRPAKIEDMLAVADMIQELADFENMPDGPKLSVEDLQNDGFHRQPPAFQCKVAELCNSEKHTLVGYALYFPTYSTWNGYSMMLEDLYVRLNYRRRGVGGRLFDSVAKEALSAGCSRLDFHVLEWNDAKVFYEGRGAKNLSKLEQWCYYRMDTEALQNISNSQHNDH